MLFDIDNIDDTEILKVTSILPLKQGLKHINGFLFFQIPAKQGLKQTNVKKLFNHKY